MVTRSAYPATGRAAPERTLFGVRNPTRFNRFAAIAAASVFMPSLLASGSALAQADFTIPWASEPSSILAVGDTISVSYEVENIGFSSSSLTVGFVIDDGVNAYLLQEDPISTLSAGGFTSGTMTFLVPSGVDGTWYAGIVADPFDTILESDEMNNVWVFASELTIGGVGPQPGTITVINDSLPSGTVGTSYSATIRQSGGSAPSFWVSSGSLPSGLSLSSSGSIFGAPTADGTYSFIVTAEEIGFTSGSASFSINVSRGSTSSIMVTPGQLPEAHVGAPYELRLSASGGAAPYGYQLIGAPAWLTIVGGGADAGTLRGTPDALGHFELTLYVLDSNGADATVLMPFDVVGTTGLVVSLTPPGAVVGREYSAEIVSGGIQPYSMQVDPGALPPGLTMNTSGDLTGVPSMVGQFEFDVSATDGEGSTVSGRVQVSVTEHVGLEITSKTVVVYINAEANASLTASGGVPPYTWQLTGGSLPEGLAFDAAAGKLVGKPPRGGMATVTFMVSDAEGSVAQSEVEVQVKLHRSSGGKGGSERAGCTCVATPLDSSQALFALFSITLAAALIARRR